MKLNMSHGSWSMSRWFGELNANVPSFLRMMRLGGAVFVFAVVCIPLCVLTFLVGLPLVLALSITEWWAEARSNTALS
jgi:hypothetical protein